MEEETSTDYMNNTVEDDFWRSSYVLGKDIGTEYGERLFFMYFSEHPEDSFSFTLIRIVGIMIIFFLALSYNSLIFIFLARFPTLRTVNNYFIANLGISNLVLNSTIPIIAWKWSSQTWILGIYTCKVTLYLLCSSTLVTYWTITLLALDRYRCIVVAARRPSFTPASILGSSTFIWGCALISCIPITNWSQEVTTKDAENVCTLILPSDNNFPIYIYVYFGVMSLLWIGPLPLSFYLLCQPCCKMLEMTSVWASSSSSTMVEANGNIRYGRRQSEVSMSDVLSPWTRRFSSQTGSSTGRQNSLSHHEETRINKRMRVTRILCSNAALVVPLWFLTSPIFLFLSIDATRSMFVPKSFLTCTIFNNALTAMYFFSLVNMMYYGYCSDNLRGKFNKVLRSGKPSHEIQENTAPIGTKINNNIIRGFKRESFEISDK